MLFSTPAPTSRETTSSTRFGAAPASLCPRDSLLSLVARCPSSPVYPPSPRVHKVHFLFLPCVPVFCPPPLTLQSDLLFTRVSGEHFTLCSQLLVAYVFMSAYMRLCYVLTTISKTYLLMQQGPCESSTLPGQQHINTISGFMFMVCFYFCDVFCECFFFPVGSVCQWHASSIFFGSTCGVAIWIFGHNFLGVCRGSAIAL